MRLPDDQSLVALYSESLNQLPHEASNSFHYVMDRCLPFTA